MAVGRGARHLAGAERSAGARPVLHDDGLLQRMRQILRKQAGEDVSLATGGVRNDDGNGFGRIPVDRAGTVAGGKYRGCRAEAQHIAPG